MEEVAVDDPRAAALRALLDEDLQARYAPINAGESPERAAARRAALHTPDDQVAATWIAVDDDGAPLGHVMLRRLGDEWELTLLRTGPGRAAIAPAEAARRVEGPCRFRDVRRTMEAPNKAGHSKESS
jgi:hypothetical protein